jgi:hypothetical protein
MMDLYRAFDDDAESICHTILSYHCSFREVLHTSAVEYLLNEVAIFDATKTCKVLHPRVTFAGL